jgi:hypothetical protein
MDLIPSPPDLEERRLAGEPTYVVIPKLTFFNAPAQVLGHSMMAIGLWLMGIYPEHHDLNRPKQTGWLWRLRGRSGFHIAMVGAWLVGLEAIGHRELMEMRRDDEA